MDIDILNEAIGGIDASIVEEALADGEKKPKVTAFTQRPWMKWAAAAVAIAVIAAGTPLALKAIGSFRNESFVAPNGGGNSGIVAPVDNGGSDSGEPESSSEPDSENNASSEQGGESRSRGSEAPGGSSTERPDDPASSSGTPSGSDVPEQPEGEFMKDNMPAATYKINGENRSFVYQKSSVVKIDGEAGYRVLDHYADADGATITVNAESGGLMRYEKHNNANHSMSGDYSQADEISEEQATEKAKRVAFSTDVAFAGLENAEVSVKFSDEGYCVTLVTDEGIVEVHLSNTGGLLYLSINKVH